MGTALRITQVLGLTSTAFLCGKTFSQSVSTVPSLLLAPAPLLAHQWKRMFDGDMIIVPGITLLGGTVFTVLGWKEPTWSARWWLYNLAADFSLLSIPYSFIFVHPIAEKLKEKAVLFLRSSSVSANAEAGFEKEETVHYLVDQWALRNLGRAALSGVASILALWAALDKTRMRELKIQA